MRRPIPRPFRALFPFFLVAALQGAAGCKAGPAPNAGFILDRPGAVKPAGIPFHRAWFKPGVDWDAYTRIMISPVDTQHLLPAASPILTAGAGDRDEQIRELALHAEASMKRAFRKDPRRRFQVVEARGSKTLDLEFAITEFTASRPALNAVSFFFIYTAVQRGGMAMEARVRDAGSGETIATFADRENAKFSPIHANDFDRLAHPESIIDEWAGQLVQVLGRRPGEVIEDPSRFRLKPWREDAP